jgi:tellurite resistance protein TehA-like permease
MELNDLFGIPAHPLVVHAAVVLLPLGAIATVIVAALPKARRYYAPIAFGLVLIGTIAVFLAQQSGESLEDRVTETELVEEHTEQGETVLPWAIAVTAVAAAVAVAQPLRRRYTQLSATAVTAVLLAAAVATASGATWTVIEVGHSGAKATWENLPGDD